MRPLGVASSEQDSYDELICQRTELLHQVYHLERSNYELHEADPEGTDSDFQEAIVENRGVIKNKKFEVAAIESIIQKNFPHAFEDLKPGKVFTPPSAEGGNGASAPEPGLAGGSGGPAFELDDDGGMLM